jgi:hypothetical protein
MFVYDCTSVHALFSSTNKQLSDLEPGGVNCGKNRECMRKHNREIGER